MSRAAVLVCVNLLTAARHRLCPLASIVRQTPSLLETNAMKVHLKARGQVYPGEMEVVRAHVPDDQVSWDRVWDSYQAPCYTTPGLEGKPWADPDIGDSNFDPTWNVLDGLVDRRSYAKQYHVMDGYPRNPEGRTGLRGRGCLGRWGPNHAADPIVTRWKRDPSHAVVTSSSGRPLLQFVAIQRRDSGEWAIPGGMVDPGEEVSATLRREFGEEALNSLQVTDDDKLKLDCLLREIFRSGTEVYRGYVDDPRNTDNAWMETVAINYHDSSGESVSRFPLTAGDDAVNVRWMDLESGLKLYASHTDFLQKVSLLHSAHW